MSGMFVPSPSNESVSRSEIGAVKGSTAVVDTLGGRASWYGVRQAFSDRRIALIITFFGAVIGGFIIGAISYRFGYRKGYSKAISHIAEGE